MRSDNVYVDLFLQGYVTETKWTYTENKYSVVHQIVCGEPLTHPQPVGRMWPAGFPLNCHVLSSSVVQSVIFKPYNDILIHY